MRRLLAPLALVAAASLLAGCGSGDDGGTPANTSRTSESAADTAASTLATPDLVPLDGNGFTVRLPGKATASKQKATSEVGVIPYTLYSARDGNGGTFVVAMTTYPKNAVLDLDGAVAGLAKALDGKVVANQKVKVRGHTARAVRITSAAGGTDATTFARTVLVGRRLFQLQYSVAGSNLASPPPIFAAVLGTVRFG